mgnify:CR=1 FL=1
MSEISSIGPKGSGQVGPSDRPERLAGNIAGQRPPESQLRPGESDTTTDRVDVSDHARFLGMLKSMSPLREDRIEAVREMIAADQYVTDDMLNVAIDRLAADLDEPASGS